MLFRSLVDGAVASGMTRVQAIELAAQTVLGAARVMLDTGKNPGELKDAVCSPGGTTIAGVRALEAASFKNAAMEAVIAAINRSLSL